MFFEQKKQILPLRVECIWLRNLAGFGMYFVAGGGGGARKERRITITTGTGTQLLDQHFLVLLSNSTVECESRMRQPDTYITIFLNCFSKIVLILCDGHLRRP